MTPAKRRKGCSSRILACKPLCTLMLGCDGNTLTANRKEKGYCGKCEEALAKKNKPPPALRGENTALYEAQRKLGARVAAALDPGWNDPRQEPHDD